MPARERAMERIGHRFIDAFNRRDAEDLVVLADPGIEFHPTSLVGASRVYHGHAGLRQWVAELETSQLQHKVRVREVRMLDTSRFLLLTEVLLEGEVISPSAMLTRLAEAGGIVEARAYLTDERMLKQIGLVPGAAVGGG